MLPYDAPSAGRGGYGGGGVVPEYLRRMWSPAHMDLEASCSQLITLVVEPARVYKTSYYRKQTKNQWARDDPAFAVIELLFLVLGTVAFGVAFRVSSVVDYVVLIAHAILIHFLLFGALMVVAGRRVAQHLRLHHAHSVEQDVEWLYSFDIHCNAFFLLFLVLYVAQYLLLPVLMSDSFLALVLANALWAAGFGLYFYVTFLGYCALPFLQRTEVFLYPVAAVGAVFALSLILHPVGLSFNLLHIMARHYFG